MQTRIKRVKKREPVSLVLQDPKKLHRGHGGQDLQQNRLGPTPQACPQRRDATRRSQETPLGTSQADPTGPFAQEPGLPTIARRATVGPYPPAA